jgi:hypothetical protein
MAKDKQQREGDGKATLDADGKVILGDTDPCCCADCGGNDCTYCGDCTPASVSATFDVPLCDCVQGVGIASTKVTTGSSFAGTFTLTQLGSSGEAACTWQYEATYSDVVATTYPSTDCTGTPDFVSDRIRITLQKIDDTTFYLYATLLTTAFGSPYLGAGILFSGYVETDSDDCCGTFNFSNAATCSTGSGYVTNGGTATVTAC